MLIYNDKLGHVVGVISRSKKNVEVIKISKASRRIVKIPVGEFEKNYVLTGVSATSTAETWLNSLIPMTERVKKELEMAKKKVEGEVVEKTPRGGSKGPRGIDKSAVITLLVTENPKKPSGGAAARFALYENGMTVGEAIAAGVTSTDLKFDSAKGFISIA